MTSGLENWMGLFSNKKPEVSRKLSKQANDLHGTKMYRNECWVHYSPGAHMEGGADPDRKLFLLVLVCKVDDLATRMSKHSKIPLHSEH